MTAEEDWKIALDVAKLAPNTGTVSMRGFTILAMDAEMQVLKHAVKDLRAALVKVLDTREAEARAWFSYTYAQDNFQDKGALEAKKYERKMLASSDAEREARVLLLTLKRWE